MARTKKPQKDQKERAKRAADIKLFMKNNLFTEVKLADVLGISRRTVQMLKAGRVTPQTETLRKWDGLVAKYARNKVA